jgi:DNA-binding MarR family transcriptional regulator
MTECPHIPEQIAELLVHVGRAARAQGVQADLTAAQWACLRFFARANASTRTPSAFAGFQATTRGTASQIIKSLEARGLIAGHRSPEDGRSFRFDLTDAGNALVSQDPLGDLTSLLGELDDPTRAAFLGTLSQICSALAQRKQTRAFGTCLDCSHFTPSGTCGFCACMAQPLDAGDINKLCGKYRRTPLQGQNHDTA